MIRRLPLRPLLFAALAAVVVAFGAPGGATAQGAQGRDWPEILKAADGQAVYWNAWGVHPPINDYSGWGHDQVKSRWRITPPHVQHADTADVVSRVVAGRPSGTAAGRSISPSGHHGEDFPALE